MHKTDKNIITTKMRNNQVIISWSVKQKQMSSSGRHVRERAFDLVFVVQ